MALNAALKAQLRARRKARVRKKIHGTKERPRLSLFRSARHVYAQLIDDDSASTLLSVSSFEKGEKKERANVAVCHELGKLLGERSKEKGVLKVVFDKNGNRYHGRVKAFADGAREGGLIF